MKKDNPEKWFVYMLECADGSIYTGITNDLETRIAKHNSGKGAKYTRGKTPVVLRASKSFDSRSDALKEEYALKQKPREEKLRLIVEWGVAV